MGQKRMRQPRGPLADSRAAEHVVLSGTSPPSFSGTTGGFGKDRGGVFDNDFRK